MLYKLNEKTEKILNDNKLTLIKANQDELNCILQLYSERIKWFKDNNINQWSEYFNFHPKDEFEKIIDEGNYYILKDDNNIIAGFELSTDSKYWKDNVTKAYYIYKLVTKVGYKNIGSIVLKICKNIAKIDNKEYLRLNCLKSNIKLNELYESHGFKLIKYNYEDYYSYTLRECVVN